MGIFSVLKIARYRHVWNNMLFSRAKSHVYAQKLTWYFIVVYIINLNFALRTER